MITKYGDLVLSPFNFLKTDSSKNDWREYQVWLKRSARRKHVLGAVIRLFSPILLAVLVFSGLFLQFYDPEYPLQARTVADKLSKTRTDMSLNRFGASGSGINSKHIETVTSGKLFTKSELRAVLYERDFSNIQDSSFNIEMNGNKYRVDTSIDTGLQSFILENLDKVNSRNIAFVALDPASGRVLSMVSFDKTDAISNLCTESQFPAASVFKIVTAAAALETCGLNPRSKLQFSGGKHTLYKSQLVEKKNRYSTTITFEDAFAQSINPVFAKLGLHYVGKSNLNKYASCFGFNKNINFELPFSQSLFSVAAGDPYHLAELACGYNRETMISPLHGALISAAIVNDGKIIEPTIIDSVKSGNGETVYVGTPRIVSAAINPATSSMLHTMMENTITDGTCRNIFKNIKKDHVLSQLSIGAKSGSINSHELRNVKYDWFVGFAEDTVRNRQLAVAVAVAHEKFIGTRAGFYARIAIKHFFENIVPDRRKKRKAKVA